MWDGVRSAHRESPLVEREGHHLCNQVRGPLLRAKVSRRSCARQRKNVTPQPNLAGFSITRHHTLTALDITRRDATTNRSSSCKRRNGARRAAVLECARVNIEEATSTRVARRNDGR